MCGTLRAAPDGTAGGTSVAASMGRLDKFLVTFFALTALFAVGAVVVTALLLERDREKSETTDRPDTADESRAATIVLLHARSIQERDAGTACRLLTGRAALDFACDMNRPRIPDELAVPKGKELSAAGAEVEARRATVELAISGTSQRQLYRLVRSGPSWQISTITPATR